MDCFDANFTLSTMPGATAGFRQMQLLPRTCRQAVDQLRTRTSSLFLKSLLKPHAVASSQS